MKNDVGWPDEVLNRKCSRTLRGLFFWSRNRLKELNKLKILECTPEGLSPEQDVELRRVATALNSTLTRLAMRWRQRAKARWVEEGDSNSHFFHAFTSARRRGNCILEIQHSNGGTSNSMCERWKDTLVILLPKVKNPEHPTNFRPISLYQTIYKVVAKVLVNRLKGVIPKLICEEQAPFVPGRSISNHCLLGQEVINKFKISKASSGFFALKVDMEQAYDKMSWKTLKLILRRMGFPLRFSDWVLNCVQDPKFSILINGQLSDGIVARSGFRQWCPLSPYLFILCSELLSLHIHQNYQKMGVSISGGGPLVSHLLYADNVLLFAGASIPNLRNIISIMEDYCSWMGQRVNRSKCAILFSNKVSSTTKSRLAKIAGCRRVEEMEYLGLKFALRRLTKVDFAPLIQKVRNHTLAWGIRHLSLAGRITLINFVLIPTYVYVVSHTIVSKSVLNEMEKICRSFLWNVDVEHRSIHYASWENISRPRKKGGLGFHTSDMLVGPLRARIAWEYICKPSNILQRCMENKYGRWPWEYEGKRGDSVS
ncbi:Putative ribonuclease H protein [Dendrobium catenatum]|uniref:Ribonuclease H protein n=1 Tax=Dendrobium catenatum TaxID=906689 RepID=A0A2I0VM08_9ASPA|nr:Putative ribonuclease H protein [Dendrobium catenatum]